MSVPEERPGRSFLAWVVGTVVTALFWMTAGAWLLAQPLAWWLVS